MCSITLALAGLSTGLQMAGQYQQSRAQAAALNAQAQVAEQNAKIQSRKGEQIAEQYAQQQRQLDAKRRLAVGQQVAAAGSSGIAAGIGSSLDILTATNNAWEEDSLNLLSNQRNATYDNYVGEVNLRNQANAARAQAKAAKQAGNMAMIGTLLSGAASMYGMKGAGGSAAPTATETAAAAQTPTAAGAYAVGADAAFGGIPGYVAKSTGVYQGMYNSFGPQVKTKGFNLFGGSF